MSEFTRHFSTPIITDTLASAEGIKMLRAIIEKRHSEDPEGMNISNLGGWHSDTRMVEWGGEAARALVYKVMTLADEYSFDSRSEGESRFGWFPEMWANISRKGNANQYHTHPGAYWSAVAYIDDGYGMGGYRPELGGEIQFSDPRMPMIRMTAPDLRIAESRDSIENNEPMMAAETGKLVMFPSWLSHAVRPYWGDQKRISIAINLIPVAKKPAP